MVANRQGCSHQINHRASTPAIKQGCKDAWWQAGSYQTIKQASKIQEAINRQEIKK
jgi:hypothetical protein